jgi:hypothetical protein
MSVLKTARWIVALFLVALLASKVARWVWGNIGYASRPRGI